MEKLEESLKLEQILFNDLNESRQKSNQIPLEFDYDYVPDNFDFERYSSKIMGRKSVNNLIKTIESIKSPIVVDVCCGPGWVSLLSAKRGARVFGYDITDVGIKNANNNKNRNLDEIQKSGGTLEYYNENVHNIPFLQKENSVNLFIGWSAFHHLDNLEEFFKKMNHSLASGGYIISVDDIGSMKINRIITWFFKFILPLKNITYLDKSKNIFTYFKKLINPEIEWHTPMEAYVGKHENAVEKIENILISNYELVYNYRYCAFVHYFVYDLAGPIWFRKMIFNILWQLDKFLIKTRICKGNLRFILAKKA